MLARDVTTAEGSGSTLGPFISVTSSGYRWRPDRFRLALHVAMQIGLSHTTYRRSSWRTVSEDSRISPSLSC
jgi:hypothetical protein